MVASSIKAIVVSPGSKQRESMAWLKGKWYRKHPSFIEQYIPWFGDIPWEYIYIYVYRKIDGFRRRFPVKANALKESLIQRRNYGLNQPIRQKKNQDLISIRSTESGLRSKPTP